MPNIDGKNLALQIQDELAQEVSNFISKGLRPPHLAALLVGDNKASETYVRNKMKACQRVGMQSSLLKFDTSITTDELLLEIDTLNADKSIDGFIVQLPLPKHIDEHKVLLHVDPKKDVDGFHPVNIGLMTQGMPVFVPATPLGIMTMLERYDIETSGKKCVVIGRSNIVGTPMSILLSRKAKIGNCTVTLTHSRTKDIANEIREADIIIAAIGIPHFVKGDMVKEGAVIIDVGINSVEDASRKRGYRLVGDVEYDALTEKASWITPVPGGVGPMTVTALLMNTVKSYKMYFVKK